MTTDTLFDLPDSPSPRLERLREQGLSGLTDMIAGHITRPYTEDELTTILDDGDYAAELMLHHVLLLWKRTAAERDDLAAACEWAQSELGKTTRPTPVDKALAARKEQDEWLERLKRYERERDETRETLVCVVAAILRRGSKDVLDMSANERLAELHQAERQRDELLDALYSIDERFIDGCDTHDDWLFMGKTARAAIAAAKGGES